MKILSIFWKNIRTVSRNPNYFLVLIVCPVVLILLASLTLNSINFENIKVGLVNKDKISLASLGEVTNMGEYDSLDDCIFDLTRTRVNACFFIGEEEGVRKIDVYLDNTQKIIEFYARQFILENVLRKQNAIIEKTADDLNSKLAIFSTSIVEVRGELNNAELELIKEEQILTQYKKNLSVVRGEVNKAYEIVEESEQGYEQLYSMGNASASENLEEFNRNKENIDIQIYLLKNFLFGKMNAMNYGNASKQLDNISMSLEQISLNLNNGGLIADSEDFQASKNELKGIIKKIESVNSTLSMIERDLDNSLNGVRDSRKKIGLFREKLNAGEREIENLSDSTGARGLSVEFKNAFELSSDPIFLMFPLLTAMIITFSAIVLSNMFTLKEVNRPSYLRSIITPTSRFSFVIGDYLANLFFIGIQIAALFFIGKYWFNFEGFSQPEVFFLALFLASSVFIFIGMCIGYLIRSEGTSTIIALFSVLVFLIMSDVLAPVTLASPLARIIIELNPFFILKQILFNHILLGQSLGEIMPLFNRLIAFFVICLIGTLIGRKISEKEALN